MRIKDRLNKIENSIQCDLIAFFSLPDRYSGVEKAQIERRLWNEYLKKGGNPKAYPAFVTGLTGEKEPIFLCMRKRADVLLDIQIGRRHII